MPGAELLTTAGLHIPVIPFVEVFGNVGTEPPAQIFVDVPKANVGVRFGLTVTVSITGIAHWPAVGVNVYEPEFWLSTTAGFHVPVIAFVEVAGNVGTVPPAQSDNDVPKLKDGVMFGSTVTVNVAGLAH